MKVKIKKQLGNYNIGQIVNVQCDEKDIPLDRYWRNRFRDSKIDGCLEIISKTRKPHLMMSAPEVICMSEIKHEKNKKRVG
jgi:hypothetical protein